LAYPALPATMGFAAPGDSGQLSVRARGAGKIPRDAAARCAKPAALLFTRSRAEAAAEVPGRALNGFASALACDDDLALWHRAVQCLAHGFSLRQAHHLPPQICPALQQRCIGWLNLVMGRHASHMIAALLRGPEKTE